MGRRQSYWRSFFSTRPTALCCLWGILISLASSKLTAAFPVSSAGTWGKPANGYSPENSASIRQADLSDLAASQRGTFRPTSPERKLLNGIRSNYQITHPGSPSLSQQSLTTAKGTIQNNSEPQAVEQATTSSGSEQQASSTKPDKPHPTHQLGWETFLAFMKHQPEQNPTISTKDSRRTSEDDELLWMTRARHYSDSTVESIPAVPNHRSPDSQTVPENSLEENPPPFEAAAGEGQSDTAAANRSAKSKQSVGLKLQSCAATAKRPVGTTPDKAEAEKLERERGCVKETAEHTCGGQSCVQEKLNEGDEHTLPRRSTDLPVTIGEPTPRDAGVRRDAGLEAQGDNSGDPDLVGAGQGRTPRFILDTLGDSSSAVTRKPVTHATPLLSQGLPNADVAVTGAAIAELLGKPVASHRSTENTEAGRYASDAPTRVSGSPSAKPMHSRSSGFSREVSTGIRENVARVESSAPSHSTELGHPGQAEDTTMLSHQEDQLGFLDQNMDSIGVSRVNSGTVAEQQRFLRLLLSAIRTADNTYGGIPAAEEALLASHKVLAPLHLKSTKLLFPFHSVRLPLNVKHTNKRQFGEDGSGTWLKTQEALQAPEDTAETVGRYPRTSKGNAIYTESKSETRKTMNKQGTEGTSSIQKTVEKPKTVGVDEGRIPEECTRNSSAPCRTADSPRSSNSTEPRTAQQKRRPHDRFQLQAGGADAHRAKEGQTLREARSPMGLVHRLTRRPSSSSGKLPQNRQLAQTDIPQEFLDKPGGTVMPEGPGTVGRLPQISYSTESNGKDPEVHTQEAMLTQLLLERHRLLSAISEHVGNVGAGLEPFAAFLDTEDPADQKVFLEISRTYPEVLRALLFFRYPLWPTATSIKRIHQELKHCAATAEDLWQTAKAWRAGTGDSTREDDLCAVLLAHKPDFAAKAARAVQLFGHVHFSLYQLACHHVTEMNFVNAVNEATTMRQVLPKVHGHLMDAILPGSPNSEKAQHDSIVKTCPLQQRPDASLVEKEISLQRQLVAHLGLLAGQLEVSSRFEAALHKLTTLLDKRTRIVKSSRPGLEASRTRMRARKRAAALRKAEAL